MLLASCSELLNFNTPAFWGRNTSGLPGQPLHICETISKVEIDEVGFGDCAHTKLPQSVGSPGDRVRIA